MNRNAVGRLGARVNKIRTKAKLSLFSNKSFNKSKLYDFSFGPFILYIIYCV